MGHFDKATAIPLIRMNKLDRLPIIRVRQTHRQYQQLNQAHQLHENGRHLAAIRERSLLIWQFP